MRLYRVVLAGAAALTVAGGLFAQAEVSFKKDIQPIFDRACTDCHGAKRQKAKLDLSAPKAFASLVNAPSAQVPSMMRVKPGDPEQSYLWLKLDNRAKEGTGMPRGFFGSKRLPEADLALVKKWIAQGAKE